MEILNTQTSQVPTKPQSQTAQSTAALSSDFETFLKMLTAQARFQDPLEPIDSSEYAAQLAQFSMVEQQVLSNDLLSNLDARFGAGDIGQMAAWIGMEARTTAAVAFDGTAITIQPKVDATADEAVLIVYDETGAEIQRQQINTDGAAFEWFGIADDGSELPGGRYSFAIESRALGEPIATNPAETYARVTEARRQGSETVLVLAGGATVTADQVSALREIPSNTDV